MKKKILSMAKLLGKFSKISERKIQNSNLIVIYWQYTKYNMPLFGNIFVLHEKIKMIK